MKSEMQILRFYLVGQRATVVKRLTKGGFNYFQTKPLNDDYFGTNI